MHAHVYKGTKMYLKRQKNKKKKKEVGGLKSGLGKEIQLYPSKITGRIFR